MGYNTIDKAAGASVAVGFGSAAYGAVNFTYEAAEKKFSADVVMELKKNLIKYEELVNNNLGAICSKVDNLKTHCEIGKISHSDLNVGIKNLEKEVADFFKKNVASNPAYNFINTGNKLVKYGLIAAGVAMVTWIGSLLFPR